MTREFDTFPFHLEVDGTCRASFAEVSGLSMEPGWDREHPLQEVVCKRGLLVGAPLPQWTKISHDGGIERRTFDIVLRAEDDGEAVRWTLADAFATKIEAPVVDAASGITAVEAITFLCGEIRRR